MKGEMEQMTELEAECRHRYRVRSIREDDYGCEERPEGVWPTVLVKLEDENGQLRLLRQKDHYLYEQQWYRARFAFLLWLFSCNEEAIFYS